LEWSRAGTHRIRGGGAPWSPSVEQQAAESSFPAAASSFSAGTGRRRGGGERRAAERGEERVRRRASLRERRLSGGGERRDVRRRGEARRPAAVEEQLARTRERGSEIWDLGLRGFFPSTRASEIWVLFTNFSLPRKFGGHFFAPREGWAGS
jgi:hypothetical protein